MVTAQITPANFDQYKVRILNSCSTFGKVNHPETWAASLHIFNFDQSAEDMATSLLVETYYTQLSQLLGKN